MHTKMHVRVLNCVNESQMCTQELGWRIHGKGGVKVQHVNIVIPGLLYCCCCPGVYIC